ncbi:MAG: leucyl aminopeptidase [Polyangiaceae bacterium]
MALDIQVRSASPSELAADVLVIGVYGTSTKGKAPFALPPALKAVDAALGGALAKLAQKEEFTAKRDQTISLAPLPSFARLKAERLVVYGLGDRRSLRDGELRAFAAKVARLATADKARTLAIALPQGAEAGLRPLAEGLELGAYRFTKYMTGDRKPKSELQSVVLGCAGKVRPTVKAAVSLGQSIAAAVNVSRDLSNEPGNVIYPETFAAAAERLAKQNGLKIQVFDFKEIRRRGMKLIDAVGRGSAREPRFVHISYTPKGAKRRIVFVGKGITFDTGGISIKPAPGMGEMKHDMSGAANVVGLMAAVAALKPKVEVHAIAPCAENMPDGDAYRPGDIWGSLDGKTVEIVNTDAEGRLVLADALAYARTLSPDLLIDNATLTGACVVALGTTCTGWYSTSEAAAREFSAAQQRSGEQMWRMPLLEDLRDQIKSYVADVKQAGERYGGSITAALFLREFVGDVPWVHCDIAGPASTERPNGWSQAKGATGHGLLTFLALIERSGTR